MARSARGNGRRRRDNRQSDVAKLDLGYAAVASPTCVTGCGNASPASGS